MYKQIIIILSIIIPFTISAQQVSNIRAQQEGREIAIYYDLSARANISLSVKVDGKRVKPRVTSGDIGKNVTAGEQRRISWQVLDENNGKFKANSVVFSVKAYAPWRAFILAEGAISPRPFQYSVGLMAGAVSRAGVYVKARSSFQFASSKGYIKPAEDAYYISSSQISVSSAEMPYYLSGKSRPMHWVVDAGVIVRTFYIRDIMGYVYGGAGYGVRQQLWQTYDGQWLNYAPTTYKGVSVDFGFMMAYKHFALSLGANTIAFKYAEIQLGIGYIFN